MACTSCSESTERVLLMVDGVNNVGLSPGKAKVHFDPNQFTQKEYVIIGGDIARRCVLGSLERQQLSGIAGRVAGTSFGRCVVGEHLKLYFNALVPAVVERLGDAQPVRDAARRLLLTPMEVKELELELELEKVSGVLKETETQNVHLKDEILLTKEQHQESGKKYEELELSHKKLQEQIAERRRDMVYKLKLCKRRYKLRKRKT
ncbi:myosin-2 heavy chain [Forsythia ovata]|uniref:Myosin-2 heavy chain n=1 Tax=Forsythia ovata TaxID=205694 RepID=A0ABD1RN38_9LAMI